jgi:hypothetical protein
LRRTTSRSLKITSTPRANCNASQCIWTSYSVSHTRAQSLTSCQFSRQRTPKKDAAEVQGFSGLTTKPLGSFRSGAPCAANTFLKLG